MNADELILISVDDHIAEPATMFDAHVPDEVPATSRRGCVDRRAAASSSGGTATCEGRNLGLNAVAGKPAEMYNIDASRYDQMRPGCYDVDERVRDMNAGGQLAGLNFPNFTGLLRPGAQPGPRSRRQRDHDQGLQRLARRRVVRRATPAASSRAACCRCSTSRRPPPRCTGWPTRAATRSRSRRTPRR